MSLDPQTWSRAGPADEAPLTAPTIVGMQARDGAQAVGLTADISTEVIASYAADAARAVPGVRRLGRRAAEDSGVTVTVAGSMKQPEVAVEIHLVLNGGADGPAAGAAVRDATIGYLRAMLGLELVLLTVVVDGADADPEAR